ncbi:hypothetical protein Tco_0610451 [Tanacetum coccineum]
MSDSDESGVTYTEISSTFEELSDIDHPGLPDYVPEPDPEVDPEEDDDEDPEEDPVDYPVDGGDDGDDEDGSSEDDEDNDMDIEVDDDEEEEEHLTPADFVVVALPAADQAPSAEKTEPFETDKSAATPPPHPAYVCQLGFLSSSSPTPVWSMQRLPVSCYIYTQHHHRSPMSLHHFPRYFSTTTPIPSPSLPSITTPTHCYDRLESWTHLVIFTTITNTLHLLSTDRREDRPKVNLPPQKRLGVTLSPAYEVGESTSAVVARPARGLTADYGFDEIVETLQGAPVSTDTELGRHMTAFETRVRQDTDEIYTRLDDEQSGRQLLAGRLNMLFRDRHAHAPDRRRHTVGDYRDAGGRPQETEAVHRGTEVDEETLNSDDRKIAPKRATRSNIAPETTNTTSVTNAQLQAMINQGVTVALAARDPDRHMNDDDSHISGAGVRRTERTTYECIYTDFLKCQPLNFKGTEGVAGLSQWFERIESVFYISNCTVENQVKFATYTLHSVALTWWNTHVKTVGHDAAYGMPWKTLMKMITNKYCPRNEIKKLEIKIWDLKWCLNQRTMQEAVEIATEIMDKKIRTFADRQTENKRKQDNNQQPQNKK